MIKRILKFLRLSPEELRTTLNYHERQERIAAPPVESEAGQAIRMMIYRPAPGKYVGLGRKVIADRRICRPSNEQWLDQMRVNAQLDAITRADFETFEKLQLLSLAGPPKK